ncbi:uncharacterized protein BDV14DRAFT_197431 [Aspergillus stella-maris]|uniref:uncharacterized protein n=1 Tax=Aspergillus stella-maris TaxID=1810926 RepID=UPI003CCE4FB9
MFTKGAAIARHNESGTRNIHEETASARRTVSHLIAESSKNPTPKVLRLRQEMIDEGKTLGETKAGIAIAGDLYRGRREHEQQLRGLDHELRGLLARADALHAAELQSLKAELQQ